MKKIRILTILLVVTLVAGASIFYACTKENNVVNNLKKETEFVAKIHKDMCVQVEVFRDENNNVHIVTGKVATDPTKPIAIIVPKTLNVEPRKTKNEEGIVIEIPNDAIYWLVPLDGNEPIKFEPVKDAKASNGTVTYTCRCTSHKKDCTTGSRCHPPRPFYIPGSNELTIVCNPVIESCCIGCTPEQTTDSSTIPFIATSTYLVQSTAVTVNSITYR